MSIIVHEELMVIRSNVKLTHDVDHSFGFKFTIEVEYNEELEKVLEYNSLFFFFLLVFSL
jgi:putative salt-induced outer membrane protein YdiY